MRTAAITPGLTRRDFLKALGAMGLPTALLLPRQPGPPMTEHTVYLGTYTDGASEGIYSFRFDPGTGALTQGRLAAASENPSFLALHPARRYLYAVNELTSYQGEPGGAVSAYAVDTEARTLTLLNRQPTHGGAPCHLSVDRTGRWVLVANYLGGNLAVFPIADDGRLGPASDVVQHEEHGPNAGRQEAPHAHSIILDEANRFAFAADLGIDRVMIYRLDTETGRLLPNDIPWAPVKAGAVCASRDEDPPALSHAGRRPD
jgi:6-phosphogluconolactonase